MRWITVGAWVLLAIDACAVLWLATWDSPGVDAAGRGMGLCFAVACGLFVGVSGAVLVFGQYAGSRAGVGSAAGLLLLPLLIVGGAQVAGLIHSREHAAFAAGKGRFPDAAHDAIAAAIIARDVEAVRRLAPGVDLEVKGAYPPGPLLDLALEEEHEAWSTRSGADGRVEWYRRPDAPVSTLPIVEALLAAGASPNPGLATATKIEDPAFLGALLQAGADPGYAAQGTPVVFEWVAVMPVGHLQMLLDRGLDPSARDVHGLPLAIACAEKSRWDLAMLLVQRGADRTAVDERGRTLAAVAADRRDFATRLGEPVDPGLEQLLALLTGPG